MAIALSSVNLGLHIARLVVRRVPHVRRCPPWFPTAFTLVSVLVYVAALPLYFKLSPDIRHQATAAMLFSFPGTLTRYMLAMHVTPHFKLFPLGTFIANTIATAFLGAFHILQRTSHLPSENACAVLQGLSDGYCGCLSTVSTFAVEVGALKTGRAWLYVALSWGVSQLLLLVVLGPSWWRGHIDDSRMCNFA